MIFTMWYFRTWPVNHRRMPNPKSRSTGRLSVSPKADSKGFYLNLLECHRTGLIQLYNKNINTMQVLIFKNGFHLRLIVIKAKQMSETDREVEQVD